MAEKKYGVTSKIAVLTIAVLMYTTSMATPALGDIAKAFPNVSPDVVKQIASLPPLMMIVFANIPGLLERFMPKKVILYIAMALMFVGITPAFFGGMTTILVTRAIFGAGYGIIFAYASSMIAYLFDGKQRDTLMGYKSAVGAASGVVFQTLGGFLATFNWRYSFIGFLLVIPAFLIILFLLPEPEKVQQTTANGAKGRLTAKTFGLALFAMLVNICMFSYMTNTAIVIVSSKIGNAAQVGLVLNLFTGVAFVAGLIFSRVTRAIFKKFTLSFALALYSVTFIVLVFAGTFPMFIVGAALFGLGFGTYNPEFTLKIFRSSPVAPSICIGIYLAGTGLGQFLSPIVLAPFAKLFGITGPRAGWYIAAVVLSLSTIASIIVIALSKAEKTSASKTTAA